jgi:hypothetical protein
MSNEPMDYSAPMVTAWRCCPQGSHLCRGDYTVGKPPIKCPHCKGLVSAGTFHITTQEWRGDGRYTLEGATRTFRRLSAAERATQGTALVVRLVSA